MLDAYAENEPMKMSFWSSFSEAHFPCRYHVCIIFLWQGEILLFCKKIYVKLSKFQHQFKNVIKLFT